MILRLSLFGLLLFLLTIPQRSNSMSNPKSELLARITRNLQALEQLEKQFPTVSEMLAAQPDASEFAKARAWIHKNRPQTSNEAAPAPPISKKQFVDSTQKAIDEIADEISVCIAGECATLVLIKKKVLADMRPAFYPVGGVMYPIGDELWKKISQSSQLAQLQAAPAAGDTTTPTDICTAGDFAAVLRGIFQVAIAEDTLEAHYKAYKAHYKAQNHDPAQIKASLPSGTSIVAAINNNKNHYLNPKERWQVFTQSEVYKNAEKTFDEWRDAVKTGALKAIERSSNAQWDFVEIETNLSKLDSPSLPYFASTYLRSLVNMIKQQALGGNISAEILTNIFYSGAGWEGHHFAERYESAYLNHKMNEQEIAAVFEGWTKAPQPASFSVISCFSSGGSKEQPTPYPMPPSPQKETETEDGHYINVALHKLEKITIPITFYYGTAPNADLPKAAISGTIYFILQPTEQTMPNGKKLIVYELAEKANIAKNNSVSADSSIPDTLEFGTGIDKIAVPESTISYKAVPFFTCTKKRTEAFGQGKESGWGIALSAGAIELGFSNAESVSTELSRDLLEFADSTNLDILVKTTYQNEAGRLDKAGKITVELRVDWTTKPSQKLLIVKKVKKYPHDFKSWTYGFLLGIDSTTFQVNSRTMFPNYELKYGDKNPAVPKAIERIIMLK